MDVRWIIVLFIAVECVLNVKNVSASTAKEKAPCQGTSLGFHSSLGDKYETYKNSYENCTYVYGNLEIIFLDDAPSYNLSFLSQIEQVEGYVLITGITTENLYLHNLRLIRGSELFNGTYSLHVSLIYRKGSTFGLEHLGFSSLKEISRGKVLVNNNTILCKYNINWNDVLLHPKEQGLEVTYINKCVGTCHPSCRAYSGQKYCWGPGAHQCQELVRSHCAGHCDNGCYGDGTRCCHKECAAGCTGNGLTDCWECRNFFNEGKCLETCPPFFRYNKVKKIYEEDPENGRLAYGSICLKECPNYLIRQSFGCVAKCSEDHYEDEAKKICVKCEKACPKVCHGFSTTSGVDYFVHAANIERFRGCTVMENNLVFLRSTFLEDPFSPIQPINASYLEIFKDIQTIKGSLAIQGLPEDVKSLDFLRNLQKVYGRQPYPQYPSQGGIHIAITQIEELDFVSLREIQNGDLEIFANGKLCLAETIPWNRIVRKGLTKIHKTQDKSTCSANGFVCGEQCIDGCWARGNDKCFSCKHYKYENRCIQNCTAEPMLYDAGNQTCNDCHPECTGGCTDEGSDHCLSCKNVLNGKHCIKECPAGSYNNQGTCDPCHENCFLNCTGPENNVGPGACDTCKIVELGKDNRVMRCLSSDRSDCPKGFYVQSITPKFLQDTLKGRSRWLTALIGHNACIRCHPLCTECNGATTASCQNCKYLKEDRNCVSNCSHSYYEETGSKECRACHSSCISCKGPSVSECVLCKQVRVYKDVNEPANVNVHEPFNCTGQCPSEKKYNITRTMEGISQVICVNRDHPIIAARLKAKDQTKYIIGGSVSAAVLLVGLLLLAAVLYRRQKSKEKTLRIQAKITGVETDMPMTPTDAKPDMSKLRLAKESELRKGTIIGSGAFGTVYKGLWIPEGENVKIPVAIKVLQEGTSPNLNQELLEEARVMCSVDHNCCVRILCVCMTAQMMLVTQLMPLGCLLDYIRKNKERIGSKPLLTWCTQIAKGMGYLEDKGIVHRDLAARNVLVQSSNHVKITDFGLSKLLNYKENEYYASGGKMPIKWLALECIQHRIFTHKSDVWSYGVTAWELFTYGEKPYDQVKARDVPEMLEKGERLSQPSICTIDVYMILIKCWMVDAESRPTFKELVDEFSKMSHDPGRYLVVQGDKLMRLPSHTVDPRDLVRTMSVSTEGPEEIVEADDYLRPTNDLAFEDDDEPSRSPSETSPLMKPNNYENSAAIDYHPEKKYNGAGRPKARRGRGDSVNSRYSSDPCKHIIQGQKDGELDIPEHLAPPTPMDELDKNHFLQRLPVDEDDYLQPKSSNPNAYLDLKPEDPSDYLSPQEEALTAQKETKTQSSLPAIMNPEYFDGVPQVAPPPQNKKANKKKKQNDYYNDYDSLYRDRPNVETRSADKTKQKHHTESTV